MWVLGSEDEDRRRPGDTSVLTRSGQWAPTVFVDQVEEGRLELWALLSCTARRLGFGNHVYVREYSGNMTVVRVQKSNCTFEA